MALSNREKILFLFLVLIGGAFLLYKFIYVPKSAEIAKLEQEISVGMDTYSELEKSIDQRPEPEDYINGMILKVREMDRLLPVKVYQEEIMIYLEKMFADYEILAPNISFSTGELSDGTDDLIKGTDVLEDLLESYGLNKVSDSIDTISSINPINSEKEGDQATGPLIKQFDVSVSFSGEYKNLKSFIAKIESNKRLIGVHNLQMFSGESEESLENMIQGSMVLSFPFYEDGKLNSLLWDISNSYGKADLFAPASDSSLTYGYSPDMTEFNRSDFYIFLDHFQAGYPTVTFGKTPYNYTAVYSDSNISETLKLIIKKDSDKLSYRCENELSSFPSEKGIFESFSPSGESININVYRRMENDDSPIPGARLIIENESGLPVYINVIGDDKDEPKFTYESSRDDVKEIRLP